MIRLRAAGGRWVHRAASVLAGAGLVALGAFAAVPLAPGAQPPVAIHWQVTSPAAVEVQGLGRTDLVRLEQELRVNADGSRFFPVFAESGDLTATPRVGLPAMAGTWRVTGEVLRFEPRFSLVPGVSYRAEYRSLKGKPLVASFQLPPPDATPMTTVVQVFPSGDVLPENQLKFYVEFSAPMNRGGTYEHVQLREVGGPVIELPFLELDEELWDLAMTRLTLLIDPGRIKRGVKPLEDIGPVFEAGKTYQLTFGAACRDSAGRSLRGAYTKTFRVEAADRVAPDPRRWTITGPAAGTLQPLRVEFDESMDHALALRLIGVRVGMNGDAHFPGERSLGAGERTWSFVPHQPWAKGLHRLTVASTIEDLAGNNPGKTFDVDLSAGAQRRATSEPVTVEFLVK